MKDDDEYDEEYGFEEDSELLLFETGVDPKLINRLHDVTADEAHTVIDACVDEEDTFPSQKALALYRQLLVQLGYSLNPKFAPQPSG